MNTKPKCVIVTGRAGAGKTTFSKRLSGEMWMPVVSRDEIKEGYVNTFGVRHDELPTETDRIVSDLFFDLVLRYLGGKVSVIIEAAFQHQVWDYRMPTLLDLSDPFIIICTIDQYLAAERHLKRGLDDPRRGIYHEDKRVALYKATGDIGIPGPYQAPELEIPTIHVSTDGDYSPSINEIIEMIRSYDH